MVISLEIAPQDIEQLTRSSDQAIEKARWQFERLYQRDRQLQADQDPVILAWHPSSQIPLFHVRKMDK